MDIAQRLANDFSGPIIFYYVWWILSEAKKREITRLYFLARDGYTLLRVAKLFCSRFQLDIECHYLYCSRAALRMPTYFFIGDEAFDLLLMWGCNISLKSVLLRADFDEKERKEVYTECGLLDVAEEKQLSKREFVEFANTLRKSSVFRKYVREKSFAAFDNAIGYFRQEGLLDSEVVAIVDSGWTGSIQRSFRQLLEFAGSSGEMVGFYFGMNELPKSLADGEYLTWLFNVETAAKDRAVFCNNLFECLLSAPHGMTRSYKLENSRYVPILTPQSDGKAKTAIIEQSNEICRYCEGQMVQASFESFDGDSLRKDTIQRIKRYMSMPTREEARYYGNFLFCDDITELYHSKLASEDQIDILKNTCFLPKRIVQKITNTTQAGNVSDMFWAYGTIAFLPKKRWWYRWNIYLWEWLKYTAKKQSTPNRKKRSLNDWFELVDAYSTISFDVFDTLVYRAVNKPTDVFYLMEPWVEKKFGLQNFCERRIAAERAARKLASQGEITLSDIYRAMGVSKEDADILMRYERETELGVIRGDTDMDTLFRYCIERGKHVLIITDMYQSKEFISEVLRHAGIFNGSHLYVSSVEGCTKHSGQLFQQIRKKEMICNCGEWLHIGDNEYSDYAVPKSLGIQAALYENARNTLNRKPNAVVQWTRKIGNWCRAHRVFQISSNFPSPSIHDLK